MFQNSLLDFVLDDEIMLTAFKMKGVGTGHSKSGVRRKWTKSHYFEQDLLQKFSNELDDKAFKSIFAGYTAKQIDWFFAKIKQNLIRPKESECHARNKLLLWLDKLHNCLSGQQMRTKYQIGITTAYSHVLDVLKATFTTFSGQNVIHFPSETMKKRMVKMLKKKNSPMPDALFAIDGSHARCTGRQFKERLSHKYKWLPCFNVTFIIERVLGTVCAFNIDASASKHDLTVLREAWFYNHIDEIMDGWIILADKGYVGVEKETSCIAAVLKKKSKGRSKLSKDYWYKMNVARSDVERIFAHFFHNKFAQLGRWPGKSKTTFLDFSANVTCCIILYNMVKLHFK